MSLGVYGGNWAGVSVEFSSVPLPHTGMYQTHGCLRVPRDQEKITGSHILQDFEGEQPKFQDTCIWRTWLKHVETSRVWSDSRKFNSSYCYLQAPLHTETWNSKLFQICPRPRFVRTTQNLALLAFRVARIPTTNTWVVMARAFLCTNGPTNAWSVLKDFIRTWGHFKQRPLCPP